VPRGSADRGHVTTAAVSIVHTVLELLLWLRGVPSPMDESTGRTWAGGVAWVRGEYAADLILVATCRHDACGEQRCGEAEVTSWLLRVNSCRRPPVQAPRTVRPLDAIGLHTTVEDADPRPETFQMYEPRQCASANLSVP